MKPSNMSGAFQEFALYLGYVFIAFALFFVVNWFRAPALVQAEERNRQRLSPEEKRKLLLLLLPQSGRYIHITGLGASVRSELFDDFAEVFRKAKWNVRQEILGNDRGIGLIVYGRDERGTELVVSSALRKLGIPYTSNNNPKYSFVGLLIGRVASE